MKILLTGGLGFIGSHTTYVLNTLDYEVVIVDNLSNSNLYVYERLQGLCPYPKRIAFYEGDVTDKSFLHEVFSKEKPESVIHFASRKAVKESIEHPLLYYRENLNGLLTLLDVMETHQCNRILFSSSATVYGTGPSPLKEDAPVGSGITNPYGQTKYFQECILQDYAKTRPK